MADVQPDAVKDAIGEKGKWLRGPLVESDDLAGRTVWSRHKFTVGSDERATRADRAARSEVRELYRETQALLAHAPELAALRSGGDPGECVEPMRRYQAEARDLRGKVEALPNNFAGMRGVFAYLELCLSCATTADRDCARARAAMPLARRAAFVSE
jgi:hypothetical protein